MHYLSIILLIFYSISLGSTITFSIDMSNSDYPNQDYDNVVINGSWNSWSGWGVTLNDEDGDEIYEGSLEVDNGTYEYVIAVTGPLDNWSGWGEVYNAPIGSSCDWNPNDQWANYGFTINNSDSNITQSYCAGGCNPFCLGTAN